MADDKTSVPASGQTDKSQDVPKSGSEGQTSDNKTTEAPSQIPENLKGKTADDLIKMYGELERKLGEQSSTVAEARKLRENQEILAKAIYSDPKLVEQVETAVKKMYGQSNETTDDVKKSEGAVKQQDPRVSELRRASENRTIAEFSARFGLDNMKPEERQEMMKKIGGKLADLVDPTGVKPVAQVLSDISLDKLPTLLEDAYWLVNKDSIMDKGALPQDFASIGRISGSTSKSGETETLTEKEKAVAEKLGVKPEKYLERKKQIQSS